MLGDLGWGGQRLGSSCMSASGPVLVPRSPSHISPVKLEPLTELLTGPSGVALSREPWLWKCPGMLAMMARAVGPHPPFVLWSHSLPAGDISNSLPHLASFWQHTGYVSVD